MCNVLTTVGWIAKKLVLDILDLQEYESQSMNALTFSLASPAGCFSLILWNILTSTGWIGTTLDADSHGSQMI